MSHIKKLTAIQLAQYEYDEDTVRLQAMNTLLSTLTTFYINLVSAKGKGNSTSGTTT
ncbi:MAG TPA: hypothetical protein PKY35_08470 [Candidatus Hydrogenedentes bacterium]|nr:hypothetical protein [Candidatus Hydrogenedentota bacterium]HOL77049.1 hypothetical protein [Candidatus Hydrogenedentota bacterium]HPO85768.1 hypothetical protein [Candidatus Hydrogenedentota bacterium]